MLTSKMDGKSLPVGIKIINGSNIRTVKESSNITRYKYFTLLLTFIIYTVYHASRKPISVVKDALHPDCNKTKSAGTTIDNCTPGWAPFDGPDASKLFSYLDSGFLITYAIGMFITGHIAERMNLRTFLVIGMVSSGIATVLFGMGRYWEIHCMLYYLIIQIICGFVQSTGWPPVVNIVANWFGKGKRGMIMGVWNSHTSIGNILGSVIAAAFVESDWGLSFIVPGLLITGVGLAVVLPFLVPHPHDLGIDVTQKSQHRGSGRKLDVESSETKDDEPLISSSSSQEISTAEPEAISFCRALKIPGVVEYSICLFFSKLVSYTFLFWLPNYISKTTSYSTSFSALLSTVFDFGGIIGGILAGVISDQTGGSALTCFTMLLLACPCLLLYNIFGSLSLKISCGLLLVCGALVNGPYALITTAISADLGSHQSLHGNAKALSTVSAIIDGTGSLGAAVGPALTGFLSKNNDWSRMFYMLIFSELVAMLVSAHIYFNQDRARSSSTSSTSSGASLVWSSVDRVKLFVYYNKRKCVIWFSIAAGLLLFVRLVVSVNTSPDNQTGV